MPITTELQPTSQSELITGVPENIRQGLGEATDSLIKLKDIPVITSMPEAKVASYLSPEQAVADINSQLANRDPSLGMPEIRAGGSDGTITQRGE